MNSLVFISMGRIINYTVINLKIFSSVIINTDENDALLYCVKNNQ